MLPNVLQKDIAATGDHRRWEFRRAHGRGGHQVPDAVARARHRVGEDVGRQREVGRQPEGVLLHVQEEAAAGRGAGRAAHGDGDGQPAQLGRHGHGQRRLAPPAPAARPAHRRRGAALRLLGHRDRRRGERLAHLQGTSTVLICPILPTLGTFELKPFNPFKSFTTCGKFKKKIRCD